MNTLSQNHRTLELYSSKRNRNIYPNPSSFEVSFAPTDQGGHCRDKSVLDPICKGAIYYSVFRKTQYITDPFIYLVEVKGIFADGSTIDSPILSFVNNNTFDLVYNYRNYIIGWKIFIVKDDNSINFNQERTITSYDPQTNLITLNRPFDSQEDGGGGSGPVIELPGKRFVLFNILPQTWSIYIPTIDNNNIVVNKTPTYYNGYYIVFENEDPNYSNSTNSNIFSRQISYYDSESQLAYFNEPLLFNYNNDTKLTLKYTLRKSLPLERWTLNKTTYYKTDKALNPLIGPLPGYVVTLPDEASQIDNYYKGKYIYLVSNNAQTYSPPLPPSDQIFPINDAFYPIYGLFLIVAYNGNTREASIQTIQNKQNNNFSNIPTYLPLPDINSSSFVPISGIEFIIEQEDYFLAFSNDSLSPDPFSGYDYGKGIISIQNLVQGKQYKVSFTVKANITPFEDFYFYQPVLNISDGYNENYIFPLSESLETYTVFITTYYNYLNFEFGFSNYNSLDNINIQWNFLEISLSDTINIVEVESDNYAPLDYNGTMVSTNQAVCYEISIVGITLPNKPLLTGSLIAFYPFVYIQLENATSPTRSGPNLIISNNPSSTKAVFTVYIPQVNSPDLQDFVTLSGGGTQIIKFKPNDNLKFSVYLPDGTPFTTLLPDTFSPYEPDPLLQIHAVFSLRRVTE